MLSALEASVAHLWAPGCATPIRWWFQRLMAQHVRFDPSSPLELDPHHVRWTDMLTADVFEQLGLGAIEIQSDAVLGDDLRIESLTTVLTPSSARRVQTAPGSSEGTDFGPQDLSLIMEAAALLSIGFGSGAAVVFFLHRRQRLHRNPGWHA